ncbi:fumarylacetoacetate hydrolase family protein [Candidimonas nitroreducens]|uniref:5-oxopent-3-ene-1,2,5-tricarboxylate decarboxylase n=1 Tax=Candidimonas nitroreducens TaxID=683354 RepID=A0A225M6P3_9BURK|nr:fumarylacetoacetate hydrolase family protein [Candidimonas nitroreducens]OWT55231.1 5-oxopent-3-ene-1,2,5-tricarboxylate decarboxylase [Candidimonas nitroreducens]
MRYVRFIFEGKKHLGAREGDKIRILGDASLESLLAQGADLETHASGKTGGQLVSEQDVTFLPVLERPTKIFCIGLNYADHTKESKYEQPTYPTIFPRYHTSLVGHGQPIVRPKVSDSLDYEGEMAVVLKKGGRHIAKADALDCVGGYALFNDGSVREYQFLTPQWTVGKNFDATGGFGPELVTPSEVPPGGRGLQLETRLNGKVVQSANTETMIFDVPTLISVISDAISLEPGDVIVTGTPSGIGWAREPKLLMHAGDVCEVSLTGFAPLRNPIVDEGAQGQG